jgi:hypothetical protein
VKRAGDGPEASGRLSRRQLIGLVAVVAALLIAGADALVFHHFSVNAAARHYPDDYLNAVACPSPAQCWAVGQTGDAPGGNTLYEARDPLLKHESGGRWTTVPASALRAPGAALESIACPGAADCWAVGGDAAGGQTVIEHWQGGVWQPVPAPALPGSQLDSVSCASASACWATGGTQSHAGATGDLLEQWNGSQWSAAATLPGGLLPQAISCPAGGRCLALGLRDGAPAAASYSAGRWTAAAPPPGRAAGTGSTSGTSSTLFGCASPTLCLAAFPGSELVTDAWNGRAWTPVTSSMISYPAGLSCSGAKGCWLLGMTRTYRPLALHWQAGGQGWTAVTGPAARHQGYLSALACGSGCWAVGGKGGPRRNGLPSTGALIEPLS